MTDPDVLRRLARLERDVERLTTLERGISDTPAFSVHKSGTDQTGVADGAFTLVTWTGALFDTHACFTSETFTPPVAGKYLLGATLTLQSSTATNAVYAVLYKNGARVAYGPIQRSPGTGSIACSFCVLMDANGTTDNFKCYILHGMTGTRVIEGNIDETYFWGHYAGPVG